MRVEALLESICMAPMATVVASGIHAIPPGLAPAVRAMIEDFARLDVDGSNVAVVQLTEGVRTVTIARVLGAVADACGCRAMVFFDALSKHMRSSLLRERVAFAVADGQFYLPGTAMLLPMAETPVALPPRRLLPSAMVSSIWWLGRTDPAGPQELADSLGISKASAVRACEALTAVGFLSKHMVGAKKHNVLYEIAGPGARVRKLVSVFGDPVKYELYVDEERAGGLLLCGESALAERSLLAAPRVPLLAASPAEGNLLRSAARDGASLERPAKVKVLAYDPRPLSDGGLVDAFTMMKTLEDADDERVVLALDEAMEGYPWYESQA